jgi:hypothetical protein
MTTHQHKALRRYMALLLGWKRATDGKPDPNGQHWLMPDGTPTTDLPAWTADDTTATNLLIMLCRPVKEGGRGWKNWRLSFRRENWTGKTFYFCEINLKHKATADSTALAITLAIIEALKAEKTSGE